MGVLAARPNLTTCLSRTVRPAQLFLDDAASCARLGLCSFGWHSLDWDFGSLSVFLANSTGIGFSAQASRSFDDELAVFDLSQDPSVRPSWTTARSLAPPFSTRWQLALG